MKELTYRQLRSLNLDSNKLNGLMRDRLPTDPLGNLPSSYIVKATQCAIVVISNLAFNEQKRLNHVRNCIDEKKKKDEFDIFGNGTPKQRSHRDTQFVLP